MIFALSLKSASTAAQERPPFWGEWGVFRFQSNGYNIPSSSNYAGFMPAGVFLGYQGDAELTSPAGSRPEAPRDSPSDTTDAVETGEW